jgi:hypothetical protein
MAMKKSKGVDGRVNSENIGGAKVPRKSGLADETGGKAVGTRDVRNVGGRFFNFAGKGRR